MKTVLRFFGILILILLILGISGALYINASGIPNYERNVPEYHVEITPERVAKGKRLVSMLCANCHMNRESGVLSGKAMTDVPSEFGTAYAPNITQDPEHGIGEYSDADLLYLLRTGVKKNGDYSPPYMPKLPNMADEDMRSIIAFLKSDDQMVRPAAVADKPCEPSFLNKLLCRTAFTPFDLPNGEIPLPDEANPVELGAYLVHNLDCFPCHSADFKTINFQNPTETPGYMGGGNTPLDLEGNPIVTSNLTPHQTGIGEMSEEEFVQALKYGQIEGEPALRYPMIPYPQLSDYEARAIYAYLLTIPPIDNEIDRGLKQGS